MIKCVVWDLDGTLWPGAVLEGAQACPDPDVLALIELLAARGIVSSVASRNDVSVLDAAWPFVAPQVGRRPKPESIVRIAEDLHIGLDAIAFVDDDPFERAQVAHALPEVVVLGPDEVRNVASRWPPAGTPEASQRVELYRANERREQALREFGGARDVFLHSCRIRLTIRAAEPTDRARVLELAERTHRMNSTGRAVLDDDNVVVATMTDRFGDYGLVAGAVVNRPGVVELLMVSCRAEGRGVPGGLLHHLGAPLTVEVVPTKQNVGLRVLLRGLGFVSTDGHTWKAPEIQLPPSWLEVRS